MERADAKSRKEKRKEARTTKRQAKQQYWLHLQQAKKERNNAYISSEPPASTAQTEYARKTRSLGKPVHKENPKRRTKFEECLEMEMGGVDTSVEEDLELQGRLAKKLKVKGRKLGGYVNELNELLGGIPSVLYSTSAVDDVEKVTEERGDSVLSSRKKGVKKKSTVISAEQIEQPAEETKTFEQFDAADEEEPCAKAPALDGKKGLKKKKKKKTNFEEFLEMEESKGAVSMEEDLEMERKLAKKLKVKGGKLGGYDDGIGDLLEGIPSVLDYASKEMIENKETGTEEESKERVMPSKKHKKKRKPSQDSTEQPEADVDANLSLGEKQESGVSEKIDEQEKEPRASAPFVDTSVKYILPHLRVQARGESEELVQLRRRVKGLLNRLSESNVESITEEIATIFRSIACSVGCQIIGEEVIASCSGGPRGIKPHAAVFAAFVAGMACLVGIDFSAKLIASLAKSFEDEFLKEDGLSLRNLTLLLSYFCIFGVCSSDLIYDLLSVLSKRLTEMDVSTILTILQCCGMKLRGDDPAAMKDFVLSIQNRVNELKSLSMSNTQELKPKINSKRMEFMLETICDIKNNKRNSNEDPAHYTQLKKWLQKLRAEDILLCGLTWSKLLDPQKKGQWWLSGEIASSSNIEEVVTTIKGDVLEAHKLVQLAAAQRMNTDIRRAIFCIIMSGEDYIDAFEKILRLDLSGKQDREVMRVLVECCLQEKVFNKYYTVLASKFCSYDKNHKFTLQYCIWDHFKELETMELRRSKNLARFIAEMLTAFTLSLSLLKTVDLADPTQLAPKRIMHFRMLFEAVFENTDAVVWNIFTRITAIPELEMLRSNIVFFIKQYVVAANPQDSILGKFKIAKKALDNVAGILM